MRIELGDRAGVALPLAALASIATRNGDHVRAARLHSAASNVADKCGAVVNWNGRHVCDRDIADLRLALTTHDFDAAWEFGRNLTLEQAATYASDVPFAADRQFFHFSNVQVPVGA